MYVFNIYILDTYVYLLTINIIENFKETDILLLIINFPTFHLL